MHASVKEAARKCLAPTTESAYLRSDSGTAQSSVSKGGNKTPRLLPRHREGEDALPIIIISQHDNDVKWLNTQLKRCGIGLRDHRQIHQQRLFSERLGGKNATWILVSLSLPAYTEGVSYTGSAAGVLNKSEVIRIEAKVIYVDKAVRGEVCFKPTSSAIARLTEYHHNTHCRILRKTAEGTYGIEARIFKTQDLFENAVQKLVFFEDVCCLGGLRKNGSGVFDKVRSARFEQSILSIFTSLAPLD